MWQSWNAKERVWRTLFFVAAVLILGIVNTWFEAIGEQQRRDKMEVLIDHIRETVDSGSTIEIRDIQRTHSLEVRDIPYMLQKIEQEDEAVGVVLSHLVTNIGKLELEIETWDTKAEWMLLWDNLAGRAARTREILADRDLTSQEQIERLRPLGVTTLPYMIEYLATSGRAQGSEAAMTLIREFIEDKDLPRTDDSKTWRTWASRNIKKYQGLKFVFHE